MEQLWAVRGRTIRALDKAGRSSLLFSQANQEAPTHPGAAMDTIFNATKPTWSCLREGSLQGRQWKGSGCCAGVNVVVVRT